MDFFFQLILFGFDFFFFIFLLIFIQDSSMEYIHSGFNNLFGAMGM